MSAPEPASGHTPPESVPEVEAGRGEQLAEWTLAAMSATVPEAVPEAGSDGSAPGDERARRRVEVTVAALRSEAPTPDAGAAE